jgi:aspartate/tyrosine/aromatic aminotransferase
MFQHIPPYAGDPILSLMEQFNADPRAEKVNLSIGLYYNEDSIVPQLETIIEAQKRIAPKNIKPNFIYQWKVLNLTVMRFKRYCLVQIALQFNKVVLLPSKRLVVQVH